MKPKYLFEKDKWMLAEHIPDSDIFFFQIPFSCFVSDTSYPFIKNYEKVLATYSKFDMDFYFGQKDSFAVAESILKALVKRPGFGKDVNRNIELWSRRLIKFARVISKLPLETYSNGKLWQLYNKHDKLHTKLYTYGWLPVSVDMFHNNFTKQLKSYLYSVSLSKEQAERAFVVLTTPVKKTIVATERAEFLTLYQKYRALLRAKSSSPGLGRELQKYAGKWGHLGYIYAGNVEPFGPNYYLKELLELARSGVDGRRLINREEGQLREMKIKQKRLLKELGVSTLYKRLFRTAQDFALTKLVRRHAQLLDLYLLHKSLLTAIASGLGVSRYHVQFMLKDEVKTALLNGKLDRKALSGRFRHCVLYTERNFDRVYQGVMEKKLRKTITTKLDKNVNELAGQTAQPGYAKGHVKIIFRAKDMTKMKKGDILVSIATDPDIVPAMKKAAAIVTEQGGITSHAAIVSRELGIPCVIGTKIATRIFKDGDMVEVDATKGIVRKIKAGR